MRNEFKWLEDYVLHLRNDKNPLYYQKSTKGRYLFFYSLLGGKQDPLIINSEFSWEENDFIVL